MKSPLHKVSRRSLVWLTVMMATLAVAAAGASVAKAGNTLTVCASSCDYSSIQDAIDAASSGDTIDVTGDFSLSSTVNVDQSVTLQGESGATISADGLNSAFAVSADNVTIEGFSFATNSDITNNGFVNITTGADNATVTDNTFKGVFSFGDSHVTRGLVVSPGVSGLSITDNKFVNIRQPAYIDNNDSGTISGNFAAGTKGWVVGAGSSMSFSGNTWGTSTSAGDNQMNAVDIAIITNASSSDSYSDVLGLSQANNDATVDNQYEHVLSTDYVDADASSGGNGYWNSPFQSVQDGVDAVVATGTVNVAAGTYNEDVTVDKALTLNGVQADNDARTRSGDESVLKSVKITVGNVTVKGFSFNGTSNQVDVTSPTKLSGIVVQNNILNGYGSVGLTTYDAGNIQVKQNLFKNPTGSGEAMQIRASSVQGGCDGSDVEDNTFNSATNNGGADVNFSCTGSDSSGISVSRNTSTGISGGSSFLGLSGITGGSVTSNTAATDGSTVFIFGDVTGTLSFDSNNFTSTGGSGMSIHAGDSGTTDPVNTGTIDFENGTLSGVHGLSVASGALGSNSQVKVHHSVVTGGVSNASGVRVDATNNWSGSASGPGTFTDVTTAPWATDSSFTTQSDNDDLTGLSLSAGTLNPAFSAAQTDYQVTVDNSVTSVTVNKGLNPGATAVVSGNTVLSVGDNVVTIVVTSADQTVSKTYNVDVARESASSSGGGGNTGGGTTTGTGGGGGTPPATTTSTPPTVTTSPDGTVTHTAPADQFGVVSVSAPATAGTNKTEQMSVVWQPGAFGTTTDPVAVTLKPVTPDAPSNGITFKGGGAALVITATLNGNPVTQLSSPMNITLPNVGKGYDCSFSHDNVHFTTIPTLTDPPNLPAGQADGCYIDDLGRYHIVTMHLTTFKVSDMSAPSTSKVRIRSTRAGLRASWTAAHDNVRVTGYVVYRNGHGYRKSLTTHILLPPKAGRYDVRARDAAGNLSKPSATIAVVRVRVTRHGKHYTVLRVKKG